jgi:hypothetical protein
VAIGEQAGDQRLDCRGGAVSAARTVVRRLSSPLRGPRNGLGRSARYDFHRYREEKRRLDPVGGAAPRDRPLILLRTNNLAATCAPHYLSANLGDSDGGLSA